MSYSRRINTTAQTQIQQSIFPRILLDIGKVTEIPLTETAVTEESIVW